MSKRIVQTQLYPVDSAVNAPRSNTTLMIGLESARNKADTIVIIKTIQPTDVLVVDAKASLLSSALSLDNLGKIKIRYRVSKHSNHYNIYLVCPV